MEGKAYNEKVCRFRTVTSDMLVFIIAGGVQRLQRSAAAEWRRRAFHHRAFTGVGTVAGNGEFASSLITEFASGVVERASNIAVDEPIDDSVPKSGSRVFSLLCPVECGKFGGFLHQHHGHHHDQSSRRTGLA